MYGFERKTSIIGKLVNQYYWKIGKTKRIRRLANQGKIQKW
jgi:hypothetical protein